VRKKERRKNCY